MPLNAIKFRRTVIIRYALLPLFLLLILFIVPAQESETATENTEEVYVNPVFPITLLLNNAEFTASGFWQPDWPYGFPPDAFRLNSNDWDSVIVRNGEEQFSVRRESGLTEFPAFLQGNMTQVRFEYAENSALLQFIYVNDSITGSSIMMEVLEYADNAPYLLRILRDDIYYFVYLQNRGLNSYESWYDTEGFLLEYFTYAYLENSGRIKSVTRLTVNETYLRNYDSRFLVTEVDISLLGQRTEIYSVNYIHELLPRYWNQQTANTQAQNLSLQWDNNNRLVRVFSESANNFIDSRYEYVFDERGNWTERHETLMIPVSGLLIPAQGTSYYRTIEYNKNSGDTAK